MRYCSLYALFGYLLVALPGRRRQALGFAILPARKSEGRHSTRVGMAYQEGYYEVGARNIQRRWGPDVARLKGLRLDRVMAAHYMHQDFRHEWDEMEPFVLEFSDGTALSVDHTDLSKLTVTVNQYDTAQDHEETLADDPEDRLEWRPVYNDDILPLMGREVDFASFVYWDSGGPPPTTIEELLSGDCAFGMVALRLDMAPDTLLIANGLDENRIDVGRTDNVTKWHGWHVVPQFPPQYMV